MAVEITQAKGWFIIWFEMDSALTLINFFNASYIPPWTLRRRWESCLQLLKQMEFRAYHIYREGNVPADILSNVALLYDDFTWWYYPILEIRSAVLADSAGRPGFRFFSFPFLLIRGFAPALLKKEKKFF